MLLVSLCSRRCAGFPVGVLYEAGGKKDEDKAIGGSNVWMGWPADGASTGLLGVPATDAILAADERSRGQVTAFDLNRANTVRQQRQRAVFDEIVCTCYGRVRRCARVGRTECMYIVPHIIAGWPRYDVERCVRFLEGNLRGNGFRVTRVPSSSSLHIEWTPPPDTAADTPLRPPVIQLPGPPEWTPADVSQHRQPRPLAPVYGASVLPPSMRAQTDALRLTERVGHGAQDTAVDGRLPGRRGGGQQPQWRAISEFKPSGRLVLTLT